MDAGGFAGVRCALAVSYTHLDVYKRQAEDWTVTNWAVLYDPPTVLSSLNCELKWNARIVRVPTTPQAIEQLRTLPGVRSLSWTE